MNGFLEKFLEMWQYQFMVKALVVGVVLAVTAGLIGVSLVLRRKAMIGDGLSHVGFGAFAIATVIEVMPLQFALPIVILAAILILQVNQKSKVDADALIAMLSAGALAVGTLVISMVKGVNTDINNYLFGSILALDDFDVVVGVIFSLLVILFFIVKYHEIFAMTFDENFAKSIGLKTERLNTIFAILCAVVVVLGMRLVGALLISSLIIFPTVTAMQAVKSFKAVVFTSVVVSVFCMVFGIIFSYFVATPTGATIVIFNVVAFLVAKVVEILKYDIS